MDSLELWVGSFADRRAAATG